MHTKTTSDNYNFKYKTMTPEQMRARSAEKVKQVQDLMKLLHIKADPRDRITNEGFIEKAIIFIDMEQYPQLPIKEEETHESNEPNNSENTEEN